MLNSLRKRGRLPPCVPATSSPILSTLMWTTPLQRSIALTTINQPTQNQTSQNMLANQIMQNQSILQRAM
jgi:hypothetical protein